MKGFLLAAAIAAPAPAASADRIEQVRFAPGADAAELRGSVQGYDSVDYRLRARAGQTLEVALRRTRGPAYFAVWAPETEQAIFFGPSAGDRFAAPLSVGGEYRVRVFMMRSAARRGQRADYVLSVRIR